MRRIVFALVLLFSSAACGDELIQGPDAVPMGSLIVLEAKAVDESGAVAWMAIDPIDLESRTFGNHFVCSSGCQAGRIVVICTYAFLKDGRIVLEQQRHIVTIGKPGPNPPGPDPPPPPVPTDFSAKVQAALEKVPSASRVVQKQIGANYRQVGNGAKTNPGAYSPAAMLDHVKTLNSSVMTVQNLTDWRPFFSELAKAFVALKLTSTDLPGHILAFDQIADVLEKP